MAGRRIRPGREAALHEGFLRHKRHRYLKLAVLLSLAATIGYIFADVKPRLVAVRGGWWSRWWRFAEVDKLQAPRLQRSPLDRWLGSASLWMDTAGAGAMSPPLRIRFLPEQEARALYAQLGRTLASRRLRW